MEKDPITKAVELREYAGFICGKDYVVDGVEKAITTSGTNDEALNKIIDFIGKAKKIEKLH